MISNGCYAQEENGRIYDKWFSGSRPRDSLLSWLGRSVKLGESRICDVGCAYGMHVLLGGPGSYGIEIERYEVSFARSLGIEIYSRDLINDDLSDLPNVDIVLALAILEHVDSPHILLRKLHSLLKPGGLLVLETPRRPAIPLLGKLPVVQKAYQEHDDHINSFTSSTLRFFCARAGFRVNSVRYWSKPLVNSYKFSPRFSGVFPFRLVASGMIVVAEKISNWEYPPKATRRAAGSARGYVSIGQNFSEVGQTADEIS